MSRNRAFAVLSSLIATLAMTVGALAFTTGAAQATPVGPYPPPPPSLVVNKGVVKYGVTVRATGRKYAAKEKVYITVYFKAKGSKTTKVVKTGSVYADKKGTFKVNIKMSKAGMVMIKAVGKSSRKTAYAAVYVIDKKNGSGSWIIKPASFTSDLAGPQPTAVSSTSSSTGGGVVLSAVALGVVVMAGGGLVTRRVVRRRQGV
jgi:hypothetical protein